MEEQIEQLESKKGDKFRSLSEMINKSLSKLVEFGDQQKKDFEQFEESEVQAIEEKKKRLHYESIRIEEEKKDLMGSKKTIDQQIDLIEQEVYEDTKD